MLGVGEIALAPVVPAGGRRCVVLSGCHAGGGILGQGRSVDRLERGLGVRYGVAHRVSRSAERRGIAAGISDVVAPVVRHFATPQRPGSDSPPR